MSTSTEVTRQLQQAYTATVSAIRLLDELIVEHDYQDVATLTSRAAAALLSAATHLMQSADEDAIEAIVEAEDLLDSIYAIINDELEED